MPIENWTPLDQIRFERGLRELLPGLRALARRLEHSDADGDEALQEALERAWRAREQLRSIGAQGAWLQRILVRQVIARHRQAIAQAPTEIDRLELLLPDVEDPATALERAHDQAQLRAALRDLGAADRVALVLHDGEGWRAEEVAEILGVGTEAARKRIQRARGRLVVALAGSQASALPRVAQEGCKEVRLLAQGLIEGRLDPVSAEGLLRHLDRCAYCPATLQAAVGAFEALAGRPPSAIDGQLRARLAALAGGNGPCG